jgi:hypothetical protein
MSNSEYNNSMAGSSSFSYANLGAYNQSYSMSVPAQGKVTSGAYIVPTWSAISYDSLTAKVPNPSGYSNIQSAYGKDANQCQTAYRSSMCNGNQ